MDNKKARLLAKPTIVEICIINSPYLVSLLGLIYSLRPRKNQFLKSVLVKLCLSLTNFKENSNNI